MENEKIFILSCQEAAKEELKKDFGCTFGPVEEAFDGKEVQEVIGFPGNKLQFRQYVVDKGLILPS